MDARRQRGRDPRFPQFDVGALPPFGELFECPEYIDHKMLVEPRILCNGGDHQHSLVLSTSELRLASGAIAADLVARPETRPARAAAR